MIIDIDTPILTTALGDLAHAVLRGRPQGVAKVLQEPCGATCVASSRVVSQRYGICWRENWENWENIRKMMEDYEKHVFHREIWDNQPWASEGYIIYYIYIFSPKRMATYGNWNTALAETPSLRVPDIFTDFDTFHPDFDWFMLITNDTNVWTNSEWLTLLKCLLLLQTNLMGYHIRNEEWQTVLEAWCTQLPVSGCLYNVQCSSVFFFVSQTPTLPKTTQHRYV